MTIATNLGFSRIGPHRDLKKALERFWANNSDAGELLATARASRNPLEAPEERGPRAGAVQRLLTVRPRARHGLDGRHPARPIPWRRQGT